MKNLIVLIPILLGVLNCGPIKNSSIDPTLINSKTSELSEGCLWQDAELEVFEQPDHKVKFRYQQCGEPRHNTVYSIFDENIGTEIGKQTFDLVDGGFFIFRQGMKTQEEFVRGKINKDQDHKGDCKPEKIAENIWTINDGLKLDAKINFMPCGNYGRNFNEQTVFIFRNDVVINQPLTGKYSPIDFSTIQFEKSDQNN